MKTCSGAACDCSPCVCVGGGGATRAVGRLCGLQATALGNCGEGRIQGGKEPLACMICGLNRLLENEMQEHGTALWRSAPSSTTPDSN